MNILIIYNVATQLKKGIPRDLDCEREIIIIVPFVKLALESAGHSVSTLECGVDLWKRLNDFKNDIDMVFNLAESFGGTNSDEPLIPAMLEALNLPFTGASAANMYLTLDKEKSKLVAQAHGIPVTQHMLIRDPADMTQIAFGFPMIVKPVREEASVGIYLNNVVSNIADLKSMVGHVMSVYSHPALVEPYIIGREISVGVVGNGSDLEVFPPLEFLFPSALKAEQAFSPSYS
jgi:D-alanine-D-alanine ligase